MMLTWLADALRAAGLNVVEHDGWQARGRGPMGHVAGVLLHHTAGPPIGRVQAEATPSLNLVLKGRADLPGPLAQLYLARNGTFHVLAAGRCNHAGAGEWHGASGNGAFIGIEAENAGDGKDPWPAVQMDAYRRGVAALLRYLGKGADMAAGHKEYALPRGRKIDPSFDMVAFRAGLAGILSGGAVPLPEVPHADPELAMLRQGSRGNDVARAQRILGLPDDGMFGPITHKAVKAFQAAHGLAADGAVGPQTWAVLLKVEAGK